MAEPYGRREKEKLDVLFDEKIEECFRDPSFGS